MKHNYNLKKMTHLFLGWSPLTNCLAPISSSTFPDYNNTLRQLQDARFACTLGSGQGQKEIAARAKSRFSPFSVTNLNFSCLPRQIAILETNRDFLSSRQQIAHFALNLVTKFAYFPLNLRVKYHVLYKLKYMKPITSTAFRIECKYGIESAKKYIGY